MLRPNFESLDQMNPDNPEQTNRRIFYTVGVLVQRSFLARMTEIAVQPYSQDCRAVVYEFREDIVEQILQQPPNVLVLETESTTFDSTRVAERIGANERGHNIDLILLIPIRVQHRYKLKTYVARYGQKVADYIMLPSPPTELERIVISLMDREATKVKTRIVQLLEDEVGRLRSIGGT